MANQLAKGEEYLKKPEKKIHSWGLFGSKYDDATELYAKSANCFKLAKSWDRAGSMFIKLCDCHLKSGSKHEAATAYVDGANCFKKTSSKWVISCLDDEMKMFLDIGKYNMVAKHCKDIGDLYELEKDIEKAAAGGDGLTD